VWVNRERAFNDAAMIKRHVMGTVLKLSIYISQLT
jgi:hypothetical protein